MFNKPKSGNFEAVHPGPEQEGLNELLGYDTIHAETTSNGRTYSVPNSKLKFPSITTVLSVNSADSIAKWRAKVGEEEADEISRIATTRGELLHECVERYVYGLDWTVGYNGVAYLPNIVGMAQPIFKALDDNLGKVWAQEAPLYSTHLGMAGRVDLIAEWDGKLSVIDFKTSKKPKKYEYLHNYFMQESGYAVMWEERTGMPIEQLVTIMTIDYEPEAAVYVEHRDNWIWKLIETKEKYDNQQTALF